MSEVIFLDRYDHGAATAHYKGQRWKRVPGEEPDAAAQWISDSVALTPADSETQRLLENAYQDSGTPAPPRHPQLEWERKPGQAVYSPAFGFGKIIAIQDNKAVAKFGKHERAMRPEELVTRAEAENDWHFYWLTGERRRLEEGRRLSLIKNLCKHEHGSWQRFLRKYNYPRSTADDLIRSYKIELRWAARNQLPGYRAIQAGDFGRQMNKYNEDPEGRERGELVKVETGKRRGTEPSYHPTLWSIRIKLPTDVLTLCREEYKREGKRAKEFWLRAAYIFVGLDPPHRAHHHRSSSSSASE
jgi:hypothetical protein